MKIEKNKIQTIVIVCIFLVSFAILFWRSFIGFQWNDESFYVESAYRFIQGDHFFQHECNTTQLSAALIMPWVYIYRFIRGNNDGIILFCRLGYLLLSSIISIVAYRIISRTKRKSAALVIALMYLFYAKQSISTFSYNTMTISFFFCTLLILYRMYDHNQLSIKYGIIAGIFYSLSVIANPFLAGILIIYILCFLFLKLGRKNIEIPQLLLKGIIIGVLCSAACFLLLFYKQNIIGQLWNNLSNMLRTTTADQRTIVRRIGSIFMSIMRLYKYTIVPYILIAVYMCRQWIKNQTISGKAEKLILILESVILGINLISSLQNRLFCGVSFIAYGMYGMAVILLSQKWHKKELQIWLIPGFFSIVLFFLASNTGEISIAAGSFFVAVGTVLVLDDYLDSKQSHPQYAFYRRSITLLSVLTVLSIFYARVFYVFRQPDISQLTERIEVGPCTGLYVTNEGKEEYTALYNVILDYTTRDDAVLISKLAPWGYLATEARCGSYTGWLMDMNNEYLQGFYEKNAEKIPNVIIQINEDYGYHNDNNPAEGYLYNEIIVKYHYQKIEDEAATIYRKN